MLLFSSWLLRFKEMSARDFPTALGFSLGCSLGELVMIEGTLLKLIFLVRVLVIVLNAPGVTFPYS